jgi:polar amino acid transport system permease protein
MDTSIPTQTVTNEKPAATRLLNAAFTFPWWLVILIGLGLFITNLILNDPDYRDIFNQLRDGITTTLTVSVVAYIAAIAIGLTVGIIRSNPPQAGTGIIGTAVSLVRLVLFNAATLYVQILRGLPILVTLLIVAYVIIPAIKLFFDSTFGITLGIRGSSKESAIIALAFTYGAFLSETFRAGIQSVARGQVEAARSLGMTYPQLMMLVVLPQAVRRILPPLGNDMIAMIKDSSLVAILGIGDITQMAKLSSSSSFLYLQTYMVAAFIYLTMTVIGSLIVRFLENRMRIEG